LPDEPAYGEDVQNHVAGVLGKAVWSMVGPGEATVKSTMELNSLTVGKRQSE